jgi:hypothetical protein
MTDLSELDKRLTELESKVNNPPKPKRTRPKSEYNIFMAKYLEENKNSKKSHKEKFIEGAEAWKKQSKNKK